MIDADGNNIPDYLEGGGEGAFAGGALCSISRAASSGTGAMPSLSLLALALGALMWRSRYSQQRSRRGPHTR
jgi:hypothetical protein